MEQQLKNGHLEKQQRCSDYRLLAKIHAPLRPNEASKLKKKKKKKKKKKRKERKKERNTESGRKSESESERERVENKGRHQIKRVKKEMLSFFFFNNIFMH